MIDFNTLSMTEIVRLQNLLQQELTRRFERQVALVFSDIVGSTPYFARYGDALGHQMQQLHFDLLKSCLPAHEGRIVNTAGDGAFMLFPAPDAATDALIEFQRLICVENSSREHDHQLQVRIGLHWGPVLVDGLTVSGDAANLCSRVGASASGGEIRLTRDVFDNITPAHQVCCTPVGLVELKGITRQVELLCLDWRDRTMFPTMFHIDETGQEIVLPRQDIISFGRLAEHEGTRANDVFLALPDPNQTRQISRWQFELRRHVDGFLLRQLSTGLTEVDGMPVAKGHEVPIRPGSVVGVGKVLTLRFSAPPLCSVPDSPDATMVARTVVR